MHVGQRIPIPRLGWAIEIEFDPDSGWELGGRPMSAPSPFDPDVEWRLEQSGTPVTVDGYGKWEFKYLVCLGCGESVELTDEPSAGVDDFPHRPSCPQRFAHTDWYREQLFD